MQVMSDPSYALRVSRLLVLFVLAMFAAGGCDNAPAKQSPPTVIEPLDLNTATTAQLEALPHIGPKHARSIMASRNARGGHFKRLEDLLDIDGIGQGTIDAIRPYVVVH